VSAVRNPESPGRILSSPAPRRRVRIHSRPAADRLRRAALVGERLVVQIDGFEHHSSSAQRTKDVRFDAELVLAGFTVLRFTYAQVVHDWDHVERTVARAIAAGAHLPR
jgi:very-short-patch-repair endonuclease